ncbi:MAG: hypothetical protein Q8Q23_00590 [bacterium]|nr:hypothetical protein [bacterium]
MSKKQLIISITSIIIIAVVGASLWYANKQQTIEPDNQPVADNEENEGQEDISEWETYDSRNTYYKNVTNPDLSFQYPKGWKLDETLIGVEIKSPDNKYYIIVDPNLEIDLPSVDTSNLKEWSKKFLERPIIGRTTQIEILEDEIKKVRNFEVYKILYNEQTIFEGNDNIFSNNNEKMIFIKINDSIFAIFNEHKDNYPQQIVNKIIDTLEFYTK